MLYTFILTTRRGKLTETEVKTVGPRLIGILASNKIHVNSVNIEPLCTGRIVSRYILKVDSRMPIFPISLIESGLSSNLFATVDIVRVPSNTSNSPQMCAV